MNFSHFKYLRMQSKNTVLCLTKMVCDELISLLVQLKLFLARQDYLEDQLAQQPHRRTSGVRRHQVDLSVYGRDRPYFFGNGEKNDTHLVYEIPDWRQKYHFRSIFAQNIIFFLYILSRPTDPNLFQSSPVNRKINLVSLDQNNCL